MNVDMLSGVLLNVDMLSGVLLSVVIPSVFVPIRFDSKAGAYPGGAPYD